MLIDGKDTRSIDAPTLRRGIGYVIQNAGLFPHRTVLDNVATVPVLQGQNKKAARAAAAELLARVGLDAAMGNRYPAQLSGGQQQRVGVARALAADPPVLLMDEPFSAVDPVVRTQLQDEFIRLQAELGKTIVFVTHDIDEAVKLGDRIAVFAVGGRLAQYAEPSEVLSRPADDFVADFVGRDRGYRALSFVASGDLPLHPEPTLALGEPVPVDAGSAAEGIGDAHGRWLLVVDDEASAAGLAGLPDGPGRTPGVQGRSGAGRLAGRAGRVTANRAGRGAVLAVRPRGRRRRRPGGGRHGRRPRRAGRHRAGPDDRGRNRRRRSLAEVRTVHEQARRRR